MATFSRSNGDAKGVVYVDVATAGEGIGQIISTGIGKYPTVYKIDTDGPTLVGQLGVGGAVEAILRTVSIVATPIAYQVEDDSSGEMRVLVESTGWATATALRDAIRALSTVNGADLSASLVTAVGFKS